MKDGVMSGLDIRAFASEIQRHLAGSRFYKAQVIEGRYVIKLNVPGENYSAFVGSKVEEKWKRINLVFDMGRAATLALEVPDADTTPPPFIMGLRKALRNAVLSGASQIGTDRILRLDFSAASGDYSLIYECFSDGNIILIDDQGTIVQAHTYRSWSSRDIRRGVPYLPPPSSLINYERESLIRIISESKRTLDRTLAVDMNLGQEYAIEACTRAGCDCSSKPAAMDDSAIEVLANTVLDIAAQAEEHREVYSYKEAGIISPIALRSVECEAKILPGFILDWGGSVKTERKSPAAEERKTARKDPVSKLERIVERQRASISELEEKAAELEKQAEAVYGMWSAAEAIARSTGKDGASAAAASHGLELVSYDPVNKVARVRTPDGKVLDIYQGRDVNYSASAYYQRAGRMRDKIKGARKALDEKLAELEAVKKRAETASSEEDTHEERVAIDPRQRWWFERYRWFVLPNGRIVAAGKDAETNESLVKKHMSTGDIYVHADIHGAPSTVIKRKDVNGADLGPITEEEIRLAGIFAVCYSKAWAKGLASFTAYWVRPEQVTKTPESGEYLARGAFVIRGKRNYMRDLEMELAIGIVDIKGRKKVMAAPVDAIRVWGVDTFAIVRPGSMEREKAVKEIARRLGVKEAHVQPLLPGGRAEVVSG